MSLPHQDWQTVVFKKKKPRTVKEAKKRGYTVKTQKKKPNNKSNGDNQYLKKLEEEKVVLKKISLETRKAIQQGRAVKKLTQLQLARAIHLPVSIVKNYELGKAIPNNHILNKMSRVLGIKLTGKNIGDSLKKN